MSLKVNIVLHDVKGWKVTKPVYMGSNVYGIGKDSETVTRYNVGVYECLSSLRHKRMQQDDWWS